MPPDSGWLSAGGKPARQAELENDAWDAADNGPDPATAQEQNSLLAAALDYASRGWRVFPLHTPGVREGKITCSCGKPHAGNLARNIGKHPRTKLGFRDATTDEEQIREWWRQWPDANVGIATGRVVGLDLHLVVVDIDSEAQAAIVKDWDLPPTLTVSTGRGSHLYFLSQTPVRHGERDGVLVRAAGGFVVAPPSLHASGKRYAFANGRAEPAVVDWPEGHGTNDDGDKSIILGTAGAKSPLFQEREPGRDRSPNEFRSVVALMAEGLGDEDILSIVLAVPAGARVRERGKEWGLGQIRRIREKFRNQIAKRFAIVTPGGKLRILDRRYPTERWMTRSDFSQSLPRVQRPIAQAWFDGAGTPRYPSVGFLPQPPGGEIKRPGGQPFNLWRGWAVEPGKGSWALFEQHLRDHICAGDAAAADWHLDFAAHMVQRPYERPSVCILHRSDEHGTGKDVFNTVLGNLLRPENVHRTADIGTITGHFNKHLSLALLVVGEEVTFAPDAQQAEKLKGLTSMASIPLQPKGIDIIQVPFYGRLIYSSNQIDPLRIEAGDRRVAMFDIPHHPHVQDTRFFAALFTEMEAGGYGGLLGHLMDRDINKFDCRKPFDTSAKRVSIRRQMHPVDELVVLILSETEADLNNGPACFSWIPASAFQSVLGISRADLELGIPLADIDRWRTRDLFYQLFVAYSGSRREAGTRAQFKTRLAKLGFTDRREGSAQSRGTPKWNFYDERSRNEAKKTLSARYGCSFDDLSR